MLLLINESMGLDLCDTIVNPSISTTDTTEPEKTSSIRFRRRHLFQPIALTSTRTPPSWH